jgi:hypothetical protein
LVFEIKTPMAYYGTRDGLISIIGAIFDEISKEMHLIVWDSWVKRLNWVIRKEEKDFHK